MQGNLFNLVFSEGLGIFCETKKVVAVFPSKVYRLCSSQNSAHWGVHEPLRSFIDLLALPTG